MRRSRLEALKYRRQGGPEKTQHASPARKYGLTKTVLGGRLVVRFKSKKT